MKESIFAEEYAAQKGFLQGLDPRIKLVIILFFILTALFVKNLAVCGILYLICLTLTGFSSINLVFFLKRTWIFIPLFSLFIAIPAIFDFFTPGDALLTVKMFGMKFSITRQGLSGAALFVSRVVVSVSFAILLSITTRHFVLLKVLGIFRIPPVFVMTLGMCYRYIYLFLDVLTHTYLAIKSRVGTRIDYQRGQRLVAWNIASLWHRSYYLHEAVYNAMLSRGFTGEFVILDDFRATRKDWMWFVASLICCSGLIWVDRIIP
ncbi:MAG: cobalt ECF transporter T component CbiQ [Syntrophaceae bacterium]|nr:cobalt ECF transporter T component CbiQ [Syntrophaceae bacterium]